MRVLVLMTLTAAGCDSSGEAEPHLFDSYAEGIAPCQEAHESLCRVYDTLRPPGAQACDAPIDDCLAIPFYYNLTDCQGADVDVNWRPCIDALDAVPCPSTEAQRTKAYEVCVSIAYPHGAGPKAPNN